MDKSNPRGSIWRKWDLQVQTILDSGYVELREYAQELKKSRPAEWESFITKVGSEQNALKFDSKVYFNTDASDNEKIRAKNYSKTFISFIEAFQNSEVCIAITDHNYDHTYLLDALISESSRSDLVSIIGGVEINIQGVHLLALFGEAIFGKASFSEGIKTFLSKINIDNKKNDGVLTVSNKSYTDVITIIKDNGGIVIFPHCCSSNGLFEERGKTDRTHLGDQFNFQEFNILQGKNKSVGDKLMSYIKSKSAELKSGYCYTTATDARSLRDILSPDIEGNYTWIKADPTFEGLRQIMFEPSRVLIQAALPEDKAGYQVIDRIEINNDLILNSVILMNSNMNSIIGGRSTGKSVLLTAIAKKLKTESSISFTNNTDYDQFVQKISSSISVIWKDGVVNDGREIEFFKQGYMNELAIDEKKLNKLVKNILILKGKNNLLENYDRKKSDLKKQISLLINDLFQVKSEIDRRTKILLEKGDRRGVDDEIRRLEQNLKHIDSLALTEKERNNYDQCKREIESSSSARDQLLKDISKVQNLRNTFPVNQDFEYEFLTISEKFRTEITKLFDSLKSEINAKWISGLDESLGRMEKLVDIEDEKIQQSQDNPDYKKADRAFKDSAQLKDLQEHIKEQKAKLNEIDSVIKEIEELNKQERQLKERIKLSHSNYFSALEELLVNLSFGQDGLDINARYKFNVDRYRAILGGALNLQSSLNKEYADYEYKDHVSYLTGVNRLLEQLVSQSITLKGGYTHQSLASAILAESFYEINYDLLYENDNFQQMSDGKKAFVVLKLLLDFSDKKCPILIDQPEDDLDNRAIYLDLVQYLKKKKIQRQVIVATHNPNIVVGADSESVIVANQHGVRNENNNGKKFAYKSGSLENSSAYDPANTIVLDAQGIREHVCMILEGGNAAFKLREKKYALEM